jgi:hypothetical protein
MPTQNQFRTVFEGPEPHIQKIAWAVELLREMLDKEPRPRIAQLWAQALAVFSEDQLAESFNALSLTSNGWPTLGDITAPILEAEYAADLAWLLQGLKLHKKAWQDRPAVYGPDYRKPGAKIDDWTAGPLLEAAIPAPPIPSRLVRALTVLGAGTLPDGLAELSRHPQGGGQWDAVEAGKVRFQVERDFKAAWMMARRRELAGK